MKKLALAILAAFTLGAASQYAVSHSVAVGISAADATAGADWFIGKSAWDQTTAEMGQCCISRTTSDDYPTGFVAECRGTKKKIADLLGVGDRVEEVIP